MKYSEWPLYVRKRYALESAVLSADDGVSPSGIAAAKKVTAAEILGWLYSILTTLDSKASALMRLNGVLIAAAAFLLSRQSGTMLSMSATDARIVALSALLSAISIFSCLLVVNVSWRFLGKCEFREDNIFEYTTELLHLDRACNFRQWAYRVSWWISLLASIAFLAEFSILTWESLF